MNKEKKEISRSIRMTQTVYDIINKFEGKNFNDKFENLVIFCLTEEDRVKTIINNQIESSKREIDSLNKRIDNRKQVLRDLDSIVWKLKDFENFVDKVTADKIEM